MADLYPVALPLFMRANNAPNVRLFPTVLFVTGARVRAEFRVQESLAGDKGSNVRPRATYGRAGVSRHGLPTPSSHSPARSPSPHAAARSPRLGCMTESPPSK
jgi:hypothetical protein